MYQQQLTISSGDKPSTIPDVAFRPDSRQFAASFKDSNEVRLFDADTGQEIRRFSNPAAELDWPHGVVFSDRFLLVSNKHNPTNRPSVINVYRLDSDDNRPVCRFVTPLPHLREAHSMSLHDGKLLVTYCGNAIPALLCYTFDEQTGQIGKLLGKVEDWFHSHGEPKGVSFSADGRQALVTFVTPKLHSKSNLLRRGMRMLLREQRGVRRFVSLAHGKLTGRRKSKKINHDADGNLSNGLARFALDENGGIASEPMQIHPQQDFSRLENIQLCDNKLVVADPVNNAVRLYRANGEDISSEPLQVIDDVLQFPHDACLSDDASHLVVANHGIAVHKGMPQWGKFVAPRQDKLVVFSR